MRSIQSKLLVMSLVTVLVSMSLVSVVALVGVNGILQDDSTEYLLAACQVEANEVDHTMERVEDSVQALYHYYLADALESEAADAEGLQTALQNLPSHDASIRQMAQTEGWNMNGCVSVYLRLDPGLSPDYPGFMYRKSASSQEMEECLPTDLRHYQDGDEEVAWYYIPINQGKATWLDAHYDTLDECEVVSYVIPLRVDGVDCGVIGMDVDVQYLRHMAQGVSVYDTGRAYLLGQNGDLIYHPDYPEGVSADEMDEELAVAFVAISTDEQSVSTFHYHGMAYRMYVTELCNGMNLCISVPISEIEQPREDMLHKIIVLIIIVCLVVMVVTIYITRMMVRPLRQLTEASQRMAEGCLDVEIDDGAQDEIGVLTRSFRQMEEKLKNNMDYINHLAYYDVLTATKNKTAYEEQISVLDTQIKEGCAEFGVVVMDINGLKQMNDTYGHDMGDLIIKDAADIMKKVYGDQCVYRIGGDEFVAFLDADQCVNYHQMSQLLMYEVERFNETNERYEAPLSVARGVAVYEKRRDLTYADVFKRADNLMYQNKRWMKEQ